MQDNPYAAPKNDTQASPDDSWADLPHDIALRGSMSIRDVLMTQVLLLRNRWFYGVLTLGIYIAFVLVLGLFAPGNRMFGNTFLVLGLIIMPAILPLTLLMVMLRLQREAKQKVGIFAMTETRLTHAGIHTKIQDKDVTLPWTTFSRFLYSQHVVLLFVADSNDHLIVARSKLVDPDDWRTLLEFLRKRYPRSV